MNMKPRQAGVAIIEYIVLGAVLVLGLVYGVSQFRDSAASATDTVGTEMLAVAGGSSLAERYSGSAGPGVTAGGSLVGRGNYSVSARASGTVQGGQRIGASVGASATVGASPSADAPASAWWRDDPDGDRQEGGFLDSVVGVGRGVGEGAAGLVTGVVDMGHGLWNISTPRMIYDFDGWTQSMSNLGNTSLAIAKDPMLVVDAVIEPVVEDWQAGRPGEAIGRGIFEVAGVIVGTKGADKVAKGGAVTRVAGAVDDVARVTPKGGLNLFKWGDEATTTAKGWKEGDHFLHLPDKGTPQANWAQNSGRLREAMNKGEPIYDSFRDPTTGLQKPTSGFLNAERKLLESRGWRYNPETGAYYPPK